jgi:hypothetical protein
MAKFMGNFILGFNQLERRTITPPAGKYSNGSIFKGSKDSPELVTTSANIDNTTLGVLLVQPEGVEIIEGDSIDLTCGTVRIDVASYEQTRIDEVAVNSSSTMANLSSVAGNDAITGNGCVIELVQVIR